MQARKLLTAIVLALTATTAGAENNCSWLGDDAELIMRERQSGYIMSTMMQDREAYPNAELLQAFVILAFNEPRWNSTERKLRATIRFRNSIELLCYGGHL